MNETVIDRATAIAQYKAAQKFSVSKSTVHKDVSERLKKLDPKLYENVKNVLKLNKSQRHIRGGNATKKKFNQVQYSVPKNNIEKSTV